MREKLNESKAAQAGLVAVLAIVAIVFYMHSKGGGESEEEAVAPEETAITSEVATTVEGGGGGGAGGGALPTTVADTKAPPRSFLAAYESNQPVVMLVVHDGGIDDRYTKLALHMVAKYEDVPAFVVPIKKLPKYASITLGLNITQVPAMITLRQRDLSHGEPQASVLYGYQTPESIVLAIQEAEYKGSEDETYHP